MQDTFDKFMQQHRGAFDNDSLPADMWEKIAKEAGVGQKWRHTIRWTAVYKYAAVLVVSLAVTLAWVLSGRTSTTAKPLSAYEAQINEAAAFYESEITKKQDAVFELTSHQPQIRDGIEQDMAMLDTVLVQLKHDLQDDISNAEVLEAMIQNYRLKLAILEEVLGYVKADTPSTEKTETHEL